MTNTEKALLDMIAYAEGTLGVSQNGYDVVVDFYRIIDWSPNTNIIHGGNDWNKAGGSDSTAAGRYQIKIGTWTGGWVGGTKTKRGQNVPFTKQNQDAAALWLIKNYRIKNSDVDSRSVTVEEITNKSKFDIMLNKLAPEWASLPLTKDLPSRGKKAGDGYYEGQGGRKSADELYSVFMKAYNLYSNQPVQTNETTDEGNDSYTVTNSDSAEYSIPTKTLSTYNLVVVFGGVDYATPTWMRKQVESSAVSLMKSNIFLFVPNKYTWAQTQAKIDLIKKTKSINQYSIVGFSGGGQDVQKYINKKNWKFIGLIDPYTNNSLINSTTFNSKTHMIYNYGHWSCCSNIPTDHPVLATKIQNANGKAKFVSIKHREMPIRFFKDYASQIV